MITFNDLKPYPPTRPMQPDPRCTDCLRKLSDDVTRMVGGKAIACQKEIRSVTKRILAEAEKKGWTSPETANEILRLISSFSGVSDPYKSIKINEMAQARKVFAEVKGRVGNDLRSLASLALLGNSFDFFRSANEALEGLSEEVENELVYFHDDLDRFENFMNEDPGLILYLTDNAGEIFFDFPLFQYIQNLARSPVLVVKGGPGLNDLTGVDLTAEAISGMFGEIMDTGTDGAGIDWRHVSSAFTTLVERADLIIAKGMANFETVYFHRLRAPVFFLFRVKCEVVADYFNAPMDSMMALWKDGAEN